MVLQCRDGHARVALSCRQMVILTAAAAAAAAAAVFPWPCVDAAATAARQLYPVAFVEYDVGYSYGTSAYGAVAADVNNDGHVDLVTAGAQGIVWFSSNSTASVPSFTVSHTIYSSSCRYVSVADLNGDGWVDVACATGGSTSPYLLWFQSDGGSPTPTFTSHALSPASKYSNNVIAVDLNNDGFKDILCVSSNTETLYWYASNGASPVPAFTQQTVASGFSNPILACVADVNNDGALDVVATNFIASGSGTGYLTWYQSNGGSSSLAFTPNAVDTVSGGSFLSAFAADLNVDGHVDIIASLQYTGVVFYQSNGASPVPSFSRNVVISLGSLTGAGLLCVQDVNGDGLPDVVVGASGSSSTAITLWLSNGATPIPSFSSVVLRTSSNSAGAVSSVFVADVNGDGAVDVVSSNSADYSYSWYVPVRAAQSP